MSMRNFDFTEIDDLYKEIILDHYRNPRNQRVLEIADIETEGMNPFCGDEIQIQVKLSDGVVHDVSFRGVGCSISCASGSILGQAIKGKNLEEARSLYMCFRDMMYGKDLSDYGDIDMGEAEALAGVKNFPIRIKCALLAWATLQEAIDKYVEN